MLTETITWGERVALAIAARKSILCVGLDPIWEKLPSDVKSGDVAQGLFAYNRNIIDRAAPFAAFFKAQYKCYSAEGEAGIAALRLTCAYIKDRHPDIPVILDAKYADIGHVVERCAHEAFDFFGVDAVTAMPAPGREALAPLTSRPGKGCFMVVRTSNPGAQELQDIPTSGGDPLYKTITEKIASGWNGSGNVGLVAPATDPHVLREVRRAAPHLPILCPGVGVQGGEAEDAVLAGVDALGAGLLINVSRGIMEASDPGEAARHWRDQLELPRAQYVPERQDGRARALHDVVLEMFNIGAIRFEEVTLKSGLVSPYYTDLRLLGSYPALLRKVAALMASTTRDAGLNPDLLVGIAMAGIPLAIALSQHTGIPAGYVRAAAKSYGTKKMVEGAWREGATALLVDDVVSDGASKLEVLENLHEAGLKVSDIIVLVDRGQGGPQLMADHGLRCHMVLTMEEVLEILLQSNLITPDKLEESRRFMVEAREQNKG
ncbi:MAG: orotidine-5'-phosphate decarboxylase [Chloroflexi bacterium]|nr:orotidine-5'-phosphate decarboxylase [Chloroflexota bacterium]